jgi:4-amino-4-deoxy-L-arabinose transferase-like glycosyltransferase
VAFWIAAILIITIAVRAYEPTGWLGSDDAAYYSAAEHILTGTPITRAHHHYARMAIIVPVAASVAVFGHHTWAVALPMFAASVACVFLVVLLGKLLFGWREGLLAGLVVSVLPYFRVLSTTAYADTHVCLWVTAAMLLCVMGLRARKRAINPNPERQRGAVWPVARAPCSVWFIACGFSLGLAISSKVFAATMLCGIVALVVSAEWKSWRPIATAAVAVACGGLLFFLAEGAFYSHFANDFLFSLHAHEQSQTGVSALAGEGAAATAGIASMIWDRMTLLMYPSVSGWGWLGVAFWPAVLASFLYGGAARCMALWAAGTFLLIAFAPVSLAGGYQPYPLFHGRHILPACIPFALCLAFVVSWIVARIEAARPASVWIPRLWPALAALVVALSFANPHELRGFRDRPTGRVGSAIREFIAATDWNPSLPIYMTPSSYWRYRILFPESLRARLRVAAASDAPDWWRDVTPDIAARQGSLPVPDAAYLLVTPAQLAGDMESWDYGVGLPAEELTMWGDGLPLLVAARDTNRKLYVAPDANSVHESVALLFGPQSLHRQQIANISTAASNQRSSAARRICFLRAADERG